MTKTLLRALYGGLFFCILASGFANGLFFSQSNAIRGIASLALSGVVVGGVYFLVRHRTQTGWVILLPASLAVVQVLSGFLLGVPLSPYLLYDLAALVGGALILLICGPLRGDRWLFPLAAIAATGWMFALHLPTEHFTYTLVGWLALATALPLLVFSLLAPYENLHDGALLAAALVITALVWLLPLAQALTPIPSSSSHSIEVTTLNWALSLGVLAAAACLLLITPVRHGLKRAWVFRSLFMRQTQQQMKQLFYDFQPALFQRVHASYEALTNSQQDMLLVENLTTETLDAWVKVCQHSETRLGKDAQELINAHIRDSRSELHPELLDYLHGAVSRADAAVIDLFLPLLIQNDRQNSLNDVLALARKNHWTPFKLYLANTREQDREQALLGLMQLYGEAGVNQEQLFDLIYPEITGSNRNRFEAVTALIQGNPALQARLVKQLIQTFKKSKPPATTSLLEDLRAIDSSGVEALFDWSVKSGEIYHIQDYLHLYLPKTILKAIAAYAGTSRGQQLWPAVELMMQKETEKKGAGHELQRQCLLTLLNLDGMRTAKAVINHHWSLPLKLIGEALEDSDQVLFEALSELLLGDKGRVADQSLALVNELAKESTRGTNPGKDQALALLEKLVLKHDANWQEMLLNLDNYSTKTAARAAAQGLVGSHWLDYLTLIGDTNPYLERITQHGLAQAFPSATPELLAKLVSELVKRHGLTESQAQEVAKGKMLPVDILYPFIMRPAESTGVENFAIEDKVQEPDERVTACHVTAWAYQNANRMTQLIVAGHANEAVCMQVSAKLSAAYTRLGKQPGDTFMVTGATFMQSGSGANRPGAIPPLEDFVAQMEDLQGITGMVKVVRITDQSYQQVVDELRSALTAGYVPDKPSFVHYTSPQSGAAYLPFYTLEHGEFKPLSFTLDEADLGSEFPDLVKLHKEEFYYEMIGDARRRKAIYEEWRHGDEDGMRQLTYNLLQAAFPNALGFSLQQYTGEYIAATLNYAQDMPWMPGIPFQMKMTMMNQRVEKLAAFGRAKGLGEVSRAGITSFQEPKFSVTGTRNYVEAVNTTGDIHHQISLQEMVEWNLPGLIRSDQDWIKKMEDILKDIDDSDPERVRRIEENSLQLMLDSFLRGWPSFYLTSERQRNAYEKWMGKRRAPVWQVIRRKLAEQKISAQPLQGDNVVFAVQKLNNHQIKITPYFLAARRSFHALLDPSVGIVWYAHPWQYRQPQPAQLPAATSRAEWHQQQMRSALRAVQAGDHSTAAAHYRKAIQLNPVRAVEEIINTCFETTTRDTTQEMAAFRALTEAIEHFEKDPEAAVEQINTFVQRYPDFLPDPYLYLGFYEHKASRDVLSLQKQIAEKAQHYQDQMKRLIRSQTLIPEGDPLEGRFKVQLNSNDWVGRAEVESLSQSQNELTDLNMKLEQKQAAAWALLMSQPNPNLMHAMALDPGYVQFCQANHHLLRSGAYQQYLFPVYLLRKGQALEAVGDHMRRGLYQGGNLIDKLKQRDMDQSSILQQLSQILSSVRVNAYLTSEDLKPLEDLQDLLGQIHSADAVVREAILRHAFKDTNSKYDRQMFMLYNQAGAQLRGFTQVRRRLSDAQAEFALYQHAYQTLLDDNTVVLLNGFPCAQIKILPDALTIPAVEVQALRLDEQSNTIQAQSAGAWTDLVRVTGLAAGERAHLAVEVQKPETLARLRSTQLAAPYAILYTPLAAPAVKVTWQSVLAELRPYLIQAFAHLGVLPLEREPEMHAAMRVMVRQLDEAEAIEQVCESVAMLEGKVGFKNRDLAS